MNTRGIGGAIQPLTGTTAPHLVWSSLSTSLSGVMSASQIARQVVGNITHAGRVENSVIWARLFVTVLIGVFPEITGIVLELRNQRIVTVMNMGTVTGVTVSGTRSVTITGRTAVLMTSTQVITRPVQDPVKVLKTTTGVKRKMGPGETAHLRPRWESISVQRLS